MLLLVMILTFLLPVLVYLIPHLLLGVLPLLLYIKLQGLLMVAYGFCYLSLSCVLPGRARIKALAWSLIWYLGSALLLFQYSGNHLIEIISNYTFFLLWETHGGKNEEWHLPFLLHRRYFLPCCNGSSFSWTFLHNQNAHIGVYNKSDFSFS